MSKLQLHMHQIREFIDDKYSFYNRYFKDIEPKHYRYNGVKKAFTVGSALDFGIKTYYQNKNKIASGCKKTALGDNIINSQEFRSLNKIDQTLVGCLLNSYMSVYKDEYFHDFNFEVFETNLHNFVIYASPDVIGYTYLDNDPVIIEIKSSGDAEGSYSAETLDFQTMTYVWSYFYKYSVMPIAVLKRTMMKPRIRQKKTETSSEFMMRLLEDITDKEDRYFKTSSREICLDDIIEFEKYLYNILIDLNYYIKSNNRYKFYKKSSDYWGC